MIVLRLLLIRHKLYKYFTDNKPDLNGYDISFAFFKMICSDYLLKATSRSIRQLDGSGTIDFYRVSSQGIVTETDSLGEPF